eukprot:6490569-Amphidinium_carterae.2
MLERVRLPDHDGIGGTHQSDIEEMAKFKLVVHLSERGKLEKCEMAWCAGLLPPGEIVYQTTPSRYLWVHFTTSCATACTVMEHHPEKGFVPSAASDVFSWLFVADIAEFVVQPTAVQSPLRTASSSTHNRIRRTAGETVPLLSYHAELGGALLTEELLRRVHTHMQWRLPDMASRQTLTVRQALGLSLVRHQLPDASEADARCYMHRGWERVHAPSFHREGIDRAVLKDVALEGDHQDLLSHVAAMDVTLEALQTAQHSVQQGVRSWTWGPGRGSKQTKSTRTTKPSYPGGETEARMREWLLAYKPAMASICCHFNKCYWQCGYKRQDGTLARKSIAWRTRGPKACLEECLTWMWNQALEIDGAVPPWH